MIADHEANVVYVADTLVRRFPSVHVGLMTILEQNDIPLRTMPGTKDIWCRDYMPIQVDQDNSFVLFRYFPDYLRHGYRHLITDAKKIIPGLPWVRSCEFSEIVLDGGNVVRHNDNAIVTDKIYKENPGIGRSALRVKLRDLLRVDRLIVVPREPFDTVGHADGMASWLDDRVLLINDYTATSESFRRRLSRSLRPHRLDLVELLYDPKSGGCDGIPRASGNWMNFLRIRDLLIIPVFGMRGDERAIRILRDAHQKYAVEAVECGELAEEGGSIHCITWQARRAEFCLG